MQKIKRVGVLPMAQIAGMFGALFGFFLGLFYGVLSMQQIDPAIVTPEVEAVIMLGWWSVLLIPVLMGLFYFVLGLLGATFYNLFAKWIGGITIELGK